MSPQKINKKMIIISFVALLLESFPYIIISPATIFMMFLNPYFIIELGYILIAVYLLKNENKIGWYLVFAFIGYKFIVGILFFFSSVFGIVNTDSNWGNGLTYLLILIPFITWLPLLIMICRKKITAHYKVFGKGA